MKITTYEDLLKINWRGNSKFMFEWKDNEEYIVLIKYQLHKYLIDIIKDKSYVVFWQGYQTKRDTINALTKFLKKLGFKAKKVKLKELELEE